MRRAILVIIAFILAAYFLSAYSTHSARQTKEAVLREDRHVMQSAMDAYTIDKGHPPSSLEDLVDAGYMRSLPSASPVLY